MVLEFKQATENGIPMNEWGNNLRKNIGIVSGYRIGKGHGLKPLKSGRSSSTTMPPSTIDKANVRWTHTN